MSKMAVSTSTDFISVAATGTDWRDVVKTVLEEVQSLRTDQDGLNFGFIYFTDALAGDAQTMLNLVRSVTEIENWVGGVGLGVVAAGQEFIDEPALSIMLCKLDESDFRIFSCPDAEDALESFAAQADPLLVLVHADPMTDEDPGQRLAEIEQITGGFIVGGLTSSRHDQVQVAPEALSGDVSGVAFSRNICVATSLTQGCRPISDYHTITRSSDHMIMELDGKPALEVLARDLWRKGDLEGEIHAAFPISGSDRGDYMVRNLINSDTDRNIIAVAHHFEEGETMMFVYRDPETVRADLSRMLVSLRERIQEEHGEFKPKAGLYISCLARACSDFPDGGEISLVQDVIGDIPLTGFYANGEIMHGRLYGYTGILTLFL